MQEMEEEERWSMFGHAYIQCLIYIYQKKLELKKTWLIMQNKAISALYKFPSLYPSCSAFQNCVVGHKTHYKKIHCSTFYFTCMRVHFSHFSLIPWLMCFSSFSFWLIISSFLLYTPINQWFLLRLVFPGHFVCVVDLASLSRSVGSLSFTVCA